jgi:hypothetical protein
MPAAYLVDPEDLQRLRGIASRLGDMQALSHDQRRDLMNLLCLVLGRIEDAPVNAGDQP